MKCRSLFQRHQRLTISDLKWFLNPQKANAAPPTKEKRGILETSTMATVLPFKARSNARCCCQCGGHFTPRQPWHPLCPTCYLGARWVSAFKVQTQLWRELAGGR